MHRPTLSSKMIGLLALGAALASAPAFAQSVGRSANDGGLVSTTGAAPRLFNSAAGSRTPASAPAAQPGRSVDDGGLVSVSGTAPAAPVSRAPSAPASSGRSPNDGGLIQ